MIIVGNSMRFMYGFFSNGVTTIKYLLNDLLKQEQLKKKVTTIQITLISRCISSIYKLSEVKSLWEREAIKSNY